jgi:hypothetical protein
MSKDIKTYTDEERENVTMNSLIVMVRSVLHALATDDDRVTAIEVMTKDLCINCGTRYYTTHDCSCRDDS